MSKTTIHPIKPDSYKKARELAGRLGVSTKTIERWGIAGKIRRYKISARLVLYNETDIESLIKESCTSWKPSLQTPKS